MMFLKMVEFKYLRNKKYKFINADLIRKFFVTTNYIRVWIGRDIFPEVFPNCEHNIEELKKIHNKIPNDF